MTPDENIKTNDEEYKDIVLGDTGSFDEDEQKITSEKIKEESEKTYFFVPKEEIEEELPQIFYAGFIMRFFAFVIDMIIAFSISKIILNTVLILGNFNISGKYYDILTTFFELLYFTISTYSTNGQTIGKTIFGLKVISTRKGEEKLTFQTVLIREFFMRSIYSYSFLWILYAFIIFSPKKQSLSDIVSDTAVILLPKVEAYELGKKEAVKLFENRA